MLAVMVCGFLTVDAAERPTVAEERGQSHERKRAGLRSF
jgi:hypothetical protein